MTILWCGGEDVDFPNGSPVGSELYTYKFESDYARAAIRSTGAYSFSNPFSGGEITSGWIRGTMYLYSPSYSGVAFGFCKYSTSTPNNLCIGYGSDGNIKLYLNGSIIATGSAYATWAVHVYDMQLISYGENATVNIFIDGTLALTYTGSILTSGVTGYDCAMIGYGAEGANNDGRCFGSIIVSDEDTRLMRLKTLSPDSEGDTSTNWTGAYTDIDETTLSDSDKIYSATDNADFQCNLTGMPYGTWSVKAVKVAARCVDGSGATGIQLGVKSGGTVNVGDTQTASGYWQTKERLMQVNPVTGVAFTPAEIEALQINLRAKAL